MAIHKNLAPDPASFAPCEGCGYCFPQKKLIFFGRNGGDPFCRKESRAKT